MSTVALSIAEPELHARLAAVLPAVGVDVAGNAAEKRVLARLVRAHAVDAVLADDPRVLEWPKLEGLPLILLMDDAEERAIEALAAGAAAVLPRALDGETLAHVVATLKAGLAVTPFTLIRPLLEAGGAIGSPGSDEVGDRSLTPRELEVLAALADGASNKAIARRLGISFHTVKFHVAGILAKLGAETRTEAVAQGARRGLVML